MLSCPGSCNASALCFMRYIGELADNLFNPKARTYLDVVPDKARSSSSSSSTAELDVDAQTLLEELRRKVTSCLTDERNLEYFELDWNKERRSSPSDDPQYLSVLTYCTLELLLNKKLEGARESAYLRQVNFYRRPLFDCPWKHANICKTFAKHFRCVYM